MSELKQLVETRKQIKARLTRLKTYFNKLCNESNIDFNAFNELKGRLTRSESLLSDYEKVHLEIVIADSNAANDDELSDFEDAYFDLTSKIKTFLATRENHVRTVSNQNVDADVCRLPSINLPTFNGKFENWDEFHDTFDSMINNNPRLSNIQKFHYLISAVKNDAAQAIKSVRITSDNYSVAWGILKRRFENKKLIVQTNIRALFELDCIKKDSYVTLQGFLDNLLRCVQSLEKYNQPTLDSLLIYLTCSKLSSKIREEWELYEHKNEFPTFQDLLQFLEEKCKRLGSVEVNAAIFSGQSLDKGKPNLKSHVSMSQPSYSCVFCKNDKHAIYNCEAFIKLDINARIATARRLHLCINCLKRNHSTKSCTLQPCQKCGKKHNTLLHLELIKNQLQDASAGQIRETGQAENCKTAPLATENPKHVTTKDADNASNSYTNHSTCSKSASQILLSTACLEIADIYGNKHLCKGLLDPGSQSNFITAELCNKLGYPKDKINMVITGVGQVNSKINEKTNISFKSRVNNFRATMSCLIIDEITDNLPAVSFNLKNLNIPEHIQLADPKCNVSSKIHVLIGANIFWDLLCNGQHKLGKGLPILQKTQLGWILGGKLVSDACEKVFNKSLINHCSIIDSNQLEKFWLMEECNSDIYSKYSLDEKYCEDHFIKTHKRADAYPHRFIVDIPTNSKFSELGESKTIALKRFYSLERKLERDCELKREYSEFLSEYERLGHMVKIDDNAIKQRPTYYLPHHAVIKESSSTSKIRVVFDASAKTVPSGLSLNDVQCVGPTIQDDLFSIVLRFRQHKFVLSADIAKMYRQILINEQQRHLQLILWRANKHEPISCYQLKTVTYGTASGSFLAMRCLKQLAIENRDKLPLVARVIEQNFYVDDLLASFPTREEAIQVQKDLSETLAEAGFELRKWSSNDEEILNSIAASSDSIENLIQISENTGLGTLGIIWHPRTDLLQYSVGVTRKDMKVTKRSILSCIAQIYDPLGLLGPVIITAKIMIQRLWQHNLSWDESVPLDLHTKFVQFRNELNNLNKLRIPRRVACNRWKRIELHAFSDASERAYGACVYIRSIDDQNSYLIRLICAKSRVAPLKNVSLPRLELCGALLLANLTHKVKRTFDIKFDACYYWCDSTIALSWIKAPPNKWKTFVANRVAKIQDLTDVDDWRHISTEENPADLISRGLHPAQLEHSTIWWRGPDFLWDRNFKIDAVVSRWDDFDHNLMEIRSAVNLSSQSHNLNLFERYSSLWKLQRVTSYCLRFINNTNSKKILGPLTVSELQHALFCLIKIAQNDNFKSEITRLSQGQEIDSKSSLLSLNPFLDEVRMLRVGGRIAQSEFEYSKKHPIILPSGHKLTKLIIRQEHLRHLHCGPNLLLSAIREKYWPIAAKSIVKKVVHECVTCFRAKPKPIQYLMGGLPKTRITPAPPFFNCGVDYAGPILIKNKKGRGCKLVKSFVCIFVCFVTKAVHIELVVDLTTNEFLSALRRFISRRGIPSNIYSDNGTNFVGANSQIQELRDFLLNDKNQNEIIESLSGQQISWHFIPSRSPHFGGLWEAGVKNLKSHLQRVAGNVNFTFDELYTLLVQIEAILNSRPLTPLSNDPDDVEPLTPSHFLIGRRLTFLPEPGLMDTADNKLNKYQHIQKLMEHFWKRWSSEYIGHLQTRTKWKRDGSIPLQIGSLVIIRDDNLQPLRWKLGRITAVHPGLDGIIRVISLMTPNGNIIKRAATKVCVLPEESD